MTDSRKPLSMEREEQLDRLAEFADECASYYDGYYARRAALWAKEKARNEGPGLDRLYGAPLADAAIRRHNGGVGVEP